MTTCTCDTLTAPPGWKRSDTTGHYPDCPAGKKPRKKPAKCVCGHLARGHGANGRCNMNRTTVGGGVYRCDCLKLEVT